MQYRFAVNFGPFSIQLTSIVLSVSYVTANLYCICVSASFMFADADAVAMKYLKFQFSITKINFDQ